MTYVKLDPTCSRLGNWLFSYAAALTAHPADQISFVIRTGNWLDDPRKYSELWPTVQYELCPATNCSQCGKCRIGTFINANTLNQPLIQQALRCPDSIRQQILHQFENALAMPTASISVRRGDYLKLPHTHPFVGKKFLAEAVNRLDDITNFIVCSDDIPWCKKFFTQNRFPEKNFYFSANGGVLVDLFLPTFCLHNIISNSTFNWWGAFLNPHKNKRIIAPSMWLGIAVKNRTAYSSVLHIENMEIIQNQYSFPRLLLASTLWGAYGTVNILRNFKKNFRGILILK